MFIFKETQSPIKKIVAILIFLVILLLLQELFRRNQWVSWGVFLIFPIVLFPWWKKHEKHSLFGWVKLYSITIGVSWYLAIRFTQLQDYQWSYIIAYLIVAANILEAAIKDISKKSFTNYLNATAGILLIVTLAGYSSMSVNVSSPYRDFAWDIPIYWIIGYTIWNIVMVYLHTPQHFGMHVAVLGSALIIGLMDNTLWLQARAYTLGIFFMLFFTYKPMFDPLRTPKVTHEKVALAGVILSLGWMIGVAVLIIM